MKYDKSNTALFKNHCKKKHPSEHIKFSKYFSEKMESENEKKDEEKEELVLKKPKKSNEVMNRFLLQGKPYGRGSKKQISFEQHLCHLTAQSLTTLSLCELSAFRELVHFLDPRISPVSRTRLTRKLNSEMYKERKEEVINELQKSKCVALQFDLWMTKKSEEFFSLNANCGHRNIHLGMPYSSGCTDGSALSVAVKNCLEDFVLSKKVISFTQDGGSNLLTCKRALDDTVNNAQIFLPATTNI